MKNLIIFDCFGVICGEIAPVWLEKHFTKEEAVLVKTKYFGRADRGEGDIKSLIYNLAQGLNIPKEQIKKEWTELFKLNNELLDFIQTLHEKHYVALLSNAPKGLVEKILEIYELEHLFDRIFISGNYSMAKPDADFYKVCLEAFEGKFTKSFMIDDNPDNLKDLEVLGIIPVLYKSNEELFYQFKEELL